MASTPESAPARIHAAQKFLKGDVVPPMELRRCAPLLLTRADPAVRKRFYEEAFRESPENSSADCSGLDFSGVVGVGAVLWQDAGLMREFGGWLQASAGGATPLSKRSRTQTWETLAEGAKGDNKPRSSEVLKVWVEQYRSFFESEHGELKNDGRLSAVDYILQIYAERALEGAPRPGLLSPVLALADEPADVARGADRAMRSRPSVDQIELKEDLRSVCSIGEDYYLARFSRQEPSPGKDRLDDKTAAHWLRRAWAGGVQPSVLDEMVRRHPKALTKLKSSPRLIESALHDMLVLFRAPDSPVPYREEDVCGRINWLFAKSGPSNRFASYGVSPGTTKLMSPAIHDALQQGAGTSVYAGNGGLLSLVGHNEQVAKHVVAQKAIPIAKVAQALLASNRETLGSALKKGVFAPIKADTLTPDEQATMCDAAAQAPTDLAQEFLSGAGFKVGWGQAHLLLDTHGKSALHRRGHSASSAKRIAHRIAEVPRPGGETCTILADAIQSHLREAAQNGPPQANLSEFRSRLRIAKDAGLRLTPGDIAALSAEKPPVAESVGRRSKRKEPSAPQGSVFRGVIHPLAAPALDLVAADIATWAGPSGAEFVGSLPGAERVQRILAVESAWQQRIKRPPPSGLSGRPCYGLRPSTYDWALEQLHKEDAPTYKPSDEPPPAPTRESREVYAYNLAVLFGTPDRVQRYLKSHFSQNDRNPFNSAAQFEIPQRPGWPISQWGDAALRDGPNLARFVKFAAPDVAPPSSITKARNQYSTQLFKEGDKHPELARLCLDLDLDQGNFDAVVEASKAITSKAGMHVPAIEIDGSEFGLPGYRWRPAEKGDARSLLAGHLVGCCQHVQGAGRAAAVHSATSPYGRCFFIERTPEANQAIQDKESQVSRPEGDGEIVAVSWGWMGRNKSLCFDSLEAIDDRCTKTFPLLLNAMRETVRSKHPSVKRVTWGSGGGTPDGWKLPMAEGRNLAKPVDYDGYRDSHNQYEVVASTKDRDLHVANAIREAMLSPRAKDKSEEMGGEM